MDKTNKNQMDIYPNEKHSYLSLISRIKKMSSARRYERRKVKQYLNKTCWMSG